MNRDEVEQKAREAFELYIKESQQHIINLDMRMSVVRSYLHRSTVPGYEDHYQHNDTHYQWIGFRDAWLTLEQRNRELEEEKKTREMEIGRLRDELQDAKSRWQHVDGDW